MCTQIENDHRKSTIMQFEEVRTPKDTQGSRKSHMEKERSSEEPATYESVIITSMGTGDINDLLADEMDQDE